MHHRREIGKRIKKLRKNHNFSQTYVANKLFISQAAYSLIENSQNGIASEHIIKLSKMYKVTTDFILKGDERTIRISREEGFLPLLRTHAHAGFLKNRDDEYFSEMKDWFRIPGVNLSHDQRLLEVEGDSMVPTILSGDILICQKQNNMDHLLAGSLVVVITKDAILVKRITNADDADYLFLENDNSMIQEEEPRVKKDIIHEIMMIKGKISSALIPSHEIAGKEKLQALEESLESFKGELFKMNKKLNALTSKYP